MSQVGFPSPALYLQPSGGNGTIAFLIEDLKPQMGGLAKEEGDNEVFTPGVLDKPQQ